MIGRIGAGEFAVLLPDLAIQGSMEGTVEKIIDEMMEPYQLSSHLQSVGLSVGIVAMPKDGVDPVLILRRSNLALPKNARASGVGNWSVFDGEMGRVADHRQWVESELHTAFERGDFDLHYQPQLDLPTGRIIGYEALIRWNHPEPRHDAAHGVHPDRRGDRDDHTRSANGFCARPAATPAICPTTVSSPSTSRRSSS